MPDKYLARSAGRTIQKTPVTQSAGAADAGKLLALGPDGKLDASTYTAGDGKQVQAIPAFEAIGAGKFVNKFVNAGVMSVRLADNSNGRVAHGFVLVNAAAAAVATVYPLDALNTAVTGLTPGADYFLGTAGGVITPALDATLPANAGYIDQKLGFAYSATELDTDDYDFVVL